MAPPGSRQRAEAVSDVVELGSGSQAVADPKPPLGWRKAGIIAIGSLSLIGAVTTIGHNLGPALMVAQETPQSQIQGMVTRGTAEERAAVVKALGPVDPQVVSLLAKNGLKIQVLHPGDDLAATGVLREQTMARFHAAKPAIKLFVSDLQGQLEQRFDGKLQQLEAERDRLAARLGMPPVPGSMAGLFPMGFGGLPQPELSPDQAKLRDLNLEIGKLSAEKNGYLFTQLSESNLSVKPFSYPVIRTHSPVSGPFGMPGPDLAPIMMAQAQMPHSLHGMATVHGAKTPEQFAQFYQLMADINGDKLAEAQRDGAARMAEMARHQGMQVDSALEKHPERVPLDHRKFNLLVPNMYYTQMGDRVVPLDEHDWGSVQRWADKDTGRINTGRTPEGEPDGIMGQYFHLDGVNTVVIRDFRLTETTPVHEVGHALEALVQKLDPTWYKAWYEKVATGFDKVGTEGGPLAISGYSRTNVGEYIADGFLYYHTEPQALKTKDADLHQRIEELIAKARELHNPLASREHATLGAILQELSRRDA